jgi:hypothetical protein
LPASPKCAPRALCPNTETRPTTSYLIDINVWLTLTWKRHPQLIPAVALVRLP